MKRIGAFSRLLLLVLIISSMLTVSAFASEYDSVAKELKTLGLFQGTDTGFDLDRAPTRTEAAVMLVRLLGAESEAKAEFSAGSISHPFTDVPSWADPYIAWLYSNNLTKGLSENSYGATGQCTAKMYCTFVLRSLGYSDYDGDFTFDQSEDLAEYLGIYDDAMGENAFLRDYAVVISYRALAATLNGTDTTLLEKLIADGAVSSTEASALLEKVKNYREYSDAFEKFNSVSSVSTSMTESFKLTNTKSTASYTQATNIIYKYISSRSDFQMEWISSHTENGTNSTISTWVKDGYYYYMDDQRKMKIELDDSLIESLFSGDISTIMPAFNQLKAAAVSRTGYGTQYVLSFADDYDYLSRLNDSQNLGIDLSALMNLSVTNSSLTVNVGSDGSIQSFKNSYDCKFLYNVDGSITPLTINYTLENRVLATGSSVYISFPDFSGFVEQG